MQLADLELFVAKCRDKAELSAEGLDGGPELSGHLLDQDRELGKSLSGRR
jgi:hypothetical protein